MKIKDKTFEIFISENKINQRVKELAFQISKNYQGQELIILPILNGAFLFASDLIKEITIPCQLSFVKVASYEGTSSCGEVKSLIGLNKDLKDMNVLIIDDIVDTGLTMSSVVAQVQALKPSSIEIATLLLKPEALQKQLELKYVGFTIPNNFVVGYGLDYDGYGRNLKDIYQVKS